MSDPKEILRASLTASLAATEPGTPAPTTTILSEAYPDSVNELLSRDPESYQQQSLSALISYYRQLRSRLATTTRPAARPKLPPAPTTLDL